MIDQMLVCFLSPPLRGSLLGCPCIYEAFFFNWMGFDREAKRHFLAAFFLMSLDFFVESCVCDSLTRAVSQSYINRSRQIYRTGAEYDMELACLKESCICDSGTITVSW